MTVYNSSKTIEVALRSIINQTYTNYEIIILDDNSQDDSVIKINNLIKNKHNIRFYNFNENNGTYYLKNYALNNIDSKTKYIAFNDSDDISSSKRIELQILDLKQNDYLFSTCFGLLQDKIYMPLISMVFDIEVFNKLGYFVNNRFGSDTDYIYRFFNYFEKLYNINIYHYYNKKSDSLFGNYKYYKCLDIVLYYIYRDNNSLTKSVDLKKRRYLNIALKKKYSKLYDINNLYYSYNIKNNNIKSEEIIINNNIEIIIENTKQINKTIKPKIKEKKNINISHDQILLNEIIQKDNEVKNIQKELDKYILLNNNLTNKLKDKDNKINEIISEINDKNNIIENLNNNSNIDEFFKIIDKNKKLKNENKNLKKITNNNNEVLQLQQQIQQINYDKNIQFENLINIISNKTFQIQQLKLGLPITNLQFSNNFQQQPNYQNNYQQQPNYQSNYQQPNYQNNLQQPNYQQPNIFQQQPNYQQPNIFQQSNYQQPNIFNCNQIYISDNLKNIDRITKIYNLNSYTDINKPTLFFGIFNNNDFDKLKNHKGDKYILWAGNDCLLNKNSIKKINNIKKLKIKKFYGSSNNIVNRMKKININCDIINLDLVDKSIFKKIEDYGNSIYISNGINEDIISYNDILYKQIVEKLPIFNYIYSNNLDKEYYEMFDIYKECFIGLRLTQNDGYSNTVDEFKVMNIPIIHNLSDYGIKWNNYNDIKLNIIYKNIDNFNKEINQQNIVILLNEKINFEKHFFINHFIKKYENIQIKYINQDLNIQNSLILLFDLINFDINKITNNCQIYLFLYNFKNNENLNYTINQCSRVYYDNIIDKELIKSNNSFPLYYKYIPFNGTFEYINKSNYRVYDYIIIFNDCLENIDIINNIINKYSDNKLIIFGNNIDKLNIQNDNITKINNLEDQNIKNKIIQTKYYLKYDENYESFYEIFSKFNGCSIKFIDLDEKLYCDITGIYGVPTILNEQYNFNNYEKNIFNYELIENTELFNKIFDQDIYLQITYNICLLSIYDKFNYIYIADSFPYIYDIKNKNKNICYYQKYNNIEIYIWILKSYQEIFHFNKSKIYFLRGLYHRTYNYICPKKSIKILYPATSLVFDLKKNIENKILTYNNLIRNPRIIKTDIKYDILLKHEDKHYDKIYNNSLKINFNKWANNKFKYLNLKRIYDLLFIATSKQESKNHDLFISFLDYCEKLKLNIKVIYITNFKEIEEKLNINSLKDRYKNIKLYLSDKLNIDELIKLYNKCRINILFSGRDACPRVLSEAGYCGCYNLVMETLSDGKFYCYNNLGKVIRNNNIELEINIKIKSLKFKPNNILFDSILDCLKIDFNHKEISEEFIKTFNSFNFYNNLKPLLLESFDKKDIQLKYKKSKFKKYKILICSTQNPYNGGGATNAYKLISYLRNIGFQVCGIFFSNNYKISIDPDNIGGIFQIGMTVDFKLKKNNLHRLNCIKNIYNYFDSNFPDLILSLNYGAPLLINKIFQNINKIYLVVGSPVLTLGDDSFINNKISFQKALQFDEEYFKKNDFELECIKIVDKIVPNNINLYKSLIKIYKNNLSNKLIKPLDYAKNIIKFKKKIGKVKKEIDLIAIASNWKRPVKNLQLVIEIFNKLPKLNKIIVGLDDKLNIPNTKIYPRVSYDICQTLLSKSKIIINTSYFESGPNIVLEAHQNNCFAICSKNIGYYKLLEDWQLCDDVYDSDEYIIKINYILQNFDKLNIPIIKKQSDRINFINFILKESNNNNNNNKKNILFVSCDIPNIGGAATNTYNMIYILKDYFNCYGLFISNLENKIKYEDNISFMKIDENIKENFMKIIKNKNIDIIFIKNYKIYCYLYKYIPSNIIKLFSPSGLRKVTNYISKTKKFYNEINNNKFYNKIELKENENILEFIKENDKNLENLVFDDSDYILPNSQITYNIIKKNIDINNNKLLNPIYLTNIYLKKENNLPDFNKRKYDIGFIAYNWDRVCKNYELVKKIIKHPKLDNLSFVIIGLNQYSYQSNNIDSFDNLNKKDLINIYKNTKSIIIPSFYDSNPNVLIEAVRYGCNIVTSPNVGNYSFINMSLLVQKYNMFDEWINKIKKSLIRKLDFIGYDSELIINQLMILFKKLKK